MPTTTMSTSDEIFKLEDTYGAHKYDIWYLYM
jgi:hypothetical protein